jgi:hypothetical protein
MEVLKLEDHSNFLEKEAKGAKRRKKLTGTEKHHLTGPSPKAKAIYKEEIRFYKEKPEITRHIERAWLWYLLSVSPLREIYNISEKIKARLPSTRTVADLSSEIRYFAEKGNGSALSREGLIYPALYELGLIKGEETITDEGHVVYTDPSKSVLFKERPFPSAGRILDEQYIDFPRSIIHSILRKEDSTIRGVAPEKEERTPDMEIEENYRLFWSYGDPRKSMGIAKDPKARGSKQWSGSIYGPQTIDPVTSISHGFVTGAACGTGSSSRDKYLNRRYIDEMDWRENPQEKEIKAWVGRNLPALIERLFYEEIAPLRGSDEYMKEVMKLDISVPKPSSLRSATVDYLNSTEAKILWIPEKRSALLEAALEAPHWLWNAWYNPKLESCVQPVVAEYSPDPNSAYLPEEKGMAKPRTDDLLCKAIIDAACSYLSYCGFPEDPEGQKKVVEYIKSLGAKGSKKEVTQYLQSQNGEVENLLGLVNETTMATWRGLLVRIYSGSYTVPENV